MSIRPCHPKQPAILTMVSCLAGITSMPPMPGHYDTRTPSKDLSGNPTTLQKTCQSKAPGLIEANTFKYAWLKSATMGTLLRGPGGL
jgi:hypothetical protein